MLRLLDNNTNSKCTQQGYAKTSEALPEHFTEQYDVRIAQLMFTELLYSRRQDKSVTYSKSIQVGACETFDLRFNLKQRNLYLS